MISFKGVSKAFRRNTVLDAVDLEIGRGDRIALVGSNGAGKTTLIRCLLGEYVHDGQVLIDGLEPRAHRAEILSKVGFVPQIPPPLKMPVGELVHFAAAVCGSAPDRMKAVIEELGIEFDRIRRLPFVKLSGGQKQKTLIGIALGRPSEVLIMDEPAANLDPEARHVLFRLLAKRMDTNAMLITSHRLDEVAALVNRVVEMDQGRVVLDDRVADNLDMATRMDCMVTMTQPDEAFARALAEWTFTQEGPLVWRGLIAAPDRLRFLAMLARYTGLLGALEMTQIEETDQCALRA